MPDNIQSSEFNALISLLDEPDEKLFAQIEKQVVFAGIHYLPQLENQLHDTFDPLVHGRIKAIIEAIHKKDIYDRLSLWIKNGGNDVMEAFILISKIIQPDIEKDKILEKISRIQQAIWLEMNENLTALEQINVFNQVFYHNYSFKGTKDGEFTLAHFNISGIVETHVGGPIGIGILYMFIAQNLKIPVFGVNLNNNFLLAYTQRYIETQKLLPDGEVLFYINPNKEGVVFLSEEIDLFIAHNKIPKQASFYLPTTNYSVIMRLVKDLIEICKLHNQEILMKRFEYIWELFIE